MSRERILVLFARGRSGRLPRSFPGSLYDEIWGV